MDPGQTRSPDGRNGQQGNGRETRCSRHRTPMCRPTGQHATKGTNKPGEMEKRPRCYWPHAFKMSMRNAHTNCQPPSLAILQVPKQSTDLTGKHVYQSTCLPSTTTMSTNPCPGIDAYYLAPMPRRPMNTGPTKQPPECQPLSHVEGPEHLQTCRAIRHPATPWDLG